MAPSSSSSSDCDESLANDLDALRQALTLTGADADVEADAVSDAPSVSDSDSDSADDDIDLLRDLQSRFSSSTAGDSSPLSRTLDSDDESDEDLATLRAIQRRFSQYEASQGREGGEEGSLDSSRLGFQSRFPKSAECFVEALKKNRACQRFIREKLIEIEAKIEENKDLKERVKCLMEFQVDSRRKTGRILGQQKDARARLVSVRKSTVSMSKKKRCIKVPFLCSGPPENSRVADYKWILRRFPFSANRQAWPNAEREKLAKGIKQQYQELMVLNSMSLDSDLDGSACSKLMCALSSKNLEVTPEKIRSFLPSVNWDRLAAMYLTGRSGAECEARWLNHEDPLINRNPWTILEEKKLLFIVQERGPINWIDIAITLGTQRTPFQCLARYQRSLNPHILKKDWTEEEDAKLRAAVENFGDNWQMVSSSLEGRTGPQCSNRWRKSILPDRRVGRWSIDEDKRLKVAVMLFGAKNWNKIARFAPGRTQVQCRERWLNCLDPSLNLEAWTAEEDAKLLEAINTHGYCWSKVATCVPPRTDSQCRRRWKVLLPHEVPLLQEARQIKRAVLVSNFVDRESERPSIGPNDFCPSVNPPVAGKESGGTTMKRPRERTKSKKQMEANSNNLSKKPRPKSKKPDQNIIADDMINSSEDNALAILPLVPLSKALHTSEMRRIRRTRSKTSSDSLPKKSRAKSGSHHENFVAIDSNADDVPIDLSHVHVKDPNTAETSLTERIRNKSSRDTQPKKARTEPERSSVGGSSVGDTVMSTETAAAGSSAVFGVTSNGAASCGHERKRKTDSRDGSRAKVLESASCDVA